MEKEPFEHNTVPFPLLVCSLFFRYNKICEKGNKLLIMVAHR